MKKNTGRPPTIPTKENTTITMKIPSTVKISVLQQARAYDMTITEYICMLVARDVAS